MSAPLKIKTHNRYRKPQHLNEKLIKHEMHVCVYDRMSMADQYYDDIVLVDLYR